MGPVDLSSLAARFEDVPVLVVGDLMLDRYVWGDVSRISPEAPVPVLRVEREEARLGGAGSVVMNVATLGARVLPVGLLGHDAAGERAVELVRAAGLPTDGLVRDPSLTTTQKTRLLARTQQLLRLDRDAPPVVSPALEAALLERALGLLEQARVVLVSDYGRGVLGGTLCARLAAAARARGVPVLADPHRDAPFERYRGVTAITPNRNETARATGIRPHDEASVLEAARALVDRLELEFAAVTLDQDGIFVLRRGEAQGRRWPAKARSVYDVAGAGDMVLAVLGLALGAGADPDAAAQLANVAAGLEVERLGVSPITPEELATELASDAPPVLRRKIVQAPAAAARIAEARRQGKRVVFTNGCFDLLHAGHVHFLQGCRAQGDFLVVGLNTDGSIRGLKGPSRPVLGLEERATVLAGLEAVDLVVPFEEPTPIALIERLRPDVLCKGQDYAGKVVVGRELVEGWGGRVELVPLLPGMSTTHVIQRIAEAGPKP